MWEQDEKGWERVYIGVQPQHSARNAIPQFPSGNWGIALLPSSRNNCDLLNNSVEQIVSRSIDLFLCNVSASIYLCISLLQVISIQSQEAGASIDWLIGNRWGGCDCHVVITRKTDWGHLVDVWGVTWSNVEHKCGFISPAFYKFKNKKNVIYTS